jgi:hypothetical protein
MKPENYYLRAVWRKMRRRCEAVDDDRYYRYGARGIKVCEEWQNYEIFSAWARETGYARGLQIDREDNDGDYEPGNCRWVTQRVNARNRSTNRWVTIEGETKLLADWLVDPRCQVRKRAFYDRVEAGWSDEKALLEPAAKFGAKGSGKLIEAFGETKTMLAWVADERCQISYDALKWQLRKGVAPEKAIVSPPAAGK